MCTLLPLGMPSAALVANHPLAATAELQGTQCPSTNPSHAKVGLRLLPAVLQSLDAQNEMTATCPPVRRPVVTHRNLPSNCTPSPPSPTFTTTAGDSGGPLFYVPAANTFMQIGLDSFGKTGCIGSPSEFCCECCRVAALPVASSGRPCLVLGKLQTLPHLRARLERQELCARCRRAEPPEQLQSYGVMRSPTLAVQMCSRTLPSCGPGLMQP